MESKNSNHWLILYSIIIPAIVAGFVAYSFDSKIDRNVSSREFLYNFNRTFLDNPKYRNISISLEKSYLKEPQGDYNFRKTFTDYEIDDYLSLMSELYLYGEEGYIQYDLIGEQFGYYICITYNSEEIKNYTKELENENFEDPFEFISNLANKLGIYEGYDCKKW